MIASVAAIGLGPTSFGGGGGGGRQRVQPQPVETPSPQATPVANLRTYAKEPDLALNPDKRYFAVIDTSKGKIRLQLFPNDAPRAVNSFIFLARNGFYNGLIFHVVRPEAGFALAGDPSCDSEGKLPCTGSAGPGYVLPLELGSRSHLKGAVAMANIAGGSDISGSQFYIALRDYTSQDGRDTVVGQIVEGLEVLENLTLRNPCFQKPSTENPCQVDPPPGDKILNITIEEV